MTPNPMPAPAPAPGGKKSSTVVVIIAVVVGALALCCGVGVLAAIAVPNFIRFESRSKQVEAKANLKAAYTAERAYFAEKDTYSDRIAEVGFLPERGNRYLYAFSPDGDLLTPGSAAGDHTGVLVDTTKHPGASPDALEEAVPKALWDEVGVHGTCPADCFITIVAAGDIDSDSTVDVWSVSTKERIIDGVTVPAGMPHNHVDDTK